MRLGALAMLAALASAQTSLAAARNSMRIGTSRIEATMALLNRPPKALMTLAQHDVAIRGPQKQGFLNAANRSHIIPYLFFIGGQKCGSSAVYRSLTDHPLLTPVALAPGEAVWRQKEPNFFSNDVTYSRLPAVMLQKYPIRQGSDDQRVSIDASPILAVGGFAAQRIRHAYGTNKGSLRFAVILRNPTLRAFSYFKFAKRADRQHMWFHDKFQHISFLQMVRQQIKILRDDGGDCKWMNCQGDFELRGGLQAKLSITTQAYHMVAMLTWGNYYPHLKNFMDGMNPKQFYVIDSRKFESDWYNEMVNIFNHYGLDPALANMSSANHEGYIANAAPDLLIHPDRAPTVAEEKQHARGSAEWMAENKIDAELAMAFNLLDEYYQPFNEKLYDLFEQTKIPFRRWGTWQDDYKAHLATKPSDTTIVSKRIIVGK